MELLYIKGKKTCIDIHIELFFVDGDEKSRC